MVGDKIRKIDGAQFVRSLEWPAKPLCLYTLNGEEPQETEIIAYTKARRCKCSAQP